MRSKRKATNFPVRWQPYTELTAAAAVACGGEASLHTSLLGGGRRDGIVEQNLLSQFEGQAKQQEQVTDDRARAEPWLALSLRVGSKEEPPRPPLPQNRLRYHYRQSSSVLPRGSSVPPPQTTYTPPGSSPAGVRAGLAPPQLGRNSLQLPLGAAGATPPEPRCGACNYDRFAADLLKKVNDDLDRRVALLRQELSAEVSKEVLRLHAAAAAAGVPLHAAAGWPQPQPCGGAWPMCPACGARPGTVAFEPYEHVCLCAECSDASLLCMHCYWSSTWTRAASRGRGRGRGRGGGAPDVAVRR